MEQVLVNNKAYRRITTTEKFIITIYLIDVPSISFQFNCQLIKDSPILSYGEYDINNSSIILNDEEIRIPMRKSKSISGNTVLTDLLFRLSCCIIESITEWPLPRSSNVSHIFEMNINTLNNSFFFSHVIMVF